MDEEIQDLEIGSKKPTEGFDVIDFIACLVGTFVAGLFVLGLWKMSEHGGPNQTFYSTNLFIFAPGLGGFVAGVISNWNVTKSIAASWISATIVGLLSCGALLGFGFEGVICIAMALPLIVPMIALGVFIGRFAMTGFNNGRRILMTAAPLVVYVGATTAYDQPGFETKTESTTMIVNAPPEKIWPKLFHLDNLPEPDQWIFKTGIAYTKGTNASGRNVGDSRQCLLTTGTMNETIAEVQENRYLRFEVLNTPPAMKEMNPFYDIHPRHENGSFKVHWGEFRLEPLPGGRTRFTGTSRYSYNIYPAAYWGLWTDTVAEQIHVRMMGEIKRRLELTSSLK